MDMLRVDTNVSVLRTGSRSLATAHVVAGSALVGWASVYTDGTAVLVATIPHTCGLTRVYATTPADALHACGGFPPAWQDAFLAACDALAAAGGAQ